MNWRGLYTLFAKEVWRFVKVTVQTVITPVITVMLYLLVFSSVLSDHVEVYAGVSYTAFLIPGLVMMTVIQNAFANSSSSLFQSKINGNLIFLLLAPLSSVEIFLAFVGASILRGLLVGLGAFIISCYFVVLPVHDFTCLFLFAVLGSGTLGGMGLISAIFADKWDHIAAFQNFIILPLSFLSGAFYSIDILPEFWRKISAFNPFFYMIDGVRYSFIGKSDMPVYLSLGIVIVFFLCVSSFNLWVLNRGYKLRT